MSRLHKYEIHDSSESPVEKARWCTAGHSLTSLQDLLSNQCSRSVILWLSFCFCISDAFDIREYHLTLSFWMILVTDKSWLHQDWGEEFSTALLSPDTLSSSDFAPSLSSRECSYACWYYSNLNDLGRKRAQWEMTSWLIGVRDSLSLE